MLIINRKYSKYAIAVFAAVEAAAAVIIQIGIGEHTDCIRFLSVLLAFFFAVLISDRSLDSLLVASALLFTVCADYCLVIMESEPRLVAMIFFNAVQLCYFFRLFLMESEKNKRILHVCVRLSVISLAVVLTLVILGELADTLSIISIIYFANLAVNIAFAFARGKQFLLFAIGLLSFAFCDIFVGLGVLALDYLGVSQNSFLYAITHTKMDMIWFFYVPSQTLISISNLKKSKEQEKG